MMAVVAATAVAAVMAAEVVVVPEVLAELKQPVMAAMVEWVQLPI
jgi:predicted metal-dependent hydrolase